MADSRYLLSGCAMLSPPAVTASFIWNRKFVLILLTSFPLNPRNLYAICTTTNWTDKVSSTQPIFLKYFKFQTSSSHRFPVIFTEFLMFFSFVQLSTVFLRKLVILVALLKRFSLLIGEWYLSCTELKRSYTRPKRRELLRFCPVSPKIKSRLSILPFANQLLSNRDLKLLWMEIWSNCFPVHCLSTLSVTNAANRPNRFFYQITSLKLSIFVTVDKDDAFKLIRSNMIAATDVLSSSRRSFGIYSI